MSEPEVLGGPEVLHPVPAFLGALGVWARNLEDPADALRAGGHLLKISTALSDLFTAFPELSSLQADGTTDQPPDRSSYNPFRPHIVKTDISEVPAQLPPSVDSGKTAWSVRSKEELEELRNRRLIWHFLRNPGTLITPKELVEVMDEEKRLGSDSRAKAFRQFISTYGPIMGLQRVGFTTSRRYHLGNPEDFSASHNEIVNTHDLPELTIREVLPVETSVTPESPETASQPRRMTMQERRLRGQGRVPSFVPREQMLLEYLEGHSGEAVRTSNLHELLPGVATSARYQALYLLAQKLRVHPEYSWRFVASGNNNNRTWMLLPEEAFADKPTECVKETEPSAEPEGPTVEALVIDSSEEVIAASNVQDTVDGSAEVSKSESVVSSVYDEAELTVLAQLLSYPGTNHAHEDLLELVGGDGEVLSRLSHKLRGDPKYKLRFRVADTGAAWSWRMELDQSKTQDISDSDQEFSGREELMTQAQVFILEHMLESKGVKYTNSDLKAVLTEAFSGLMPGDIHKVVRAFKNELRHHPIYAGYVHYSGAGSDGTMWFEEPVARTYGRRRLTNWGLEQDESGYLVNGRALSLHSLSQRCLALLVEYPHGITRDRIRDLLQAQEDEGKTGIAVSDHHVAIALGEVKTQVSRYQLPERLTSVDIPKGADFVSVLKLDT